MKMLIKCAPHPTISRSMITDMFSPDCANRQKEKAPSRAWERAVMVARDAAYAGI